MSKLNVITIHDPIRVTTLEQFHSLLFVNLYSYIYFSDNGLKAIERFPAGEKKRQTVISEEDVNGISFNRTGCRLIWTNKEAGKIRSSTVLGKNITTIVGPPKNTLFKNPTDTAVFGDYLFVVSQNENKLVRISKDKHTIKSSTVGNAVLKNPGRIIIQKVNSVEDNKCSKGTFDDLPQTGKRKMSSLQRLMGWTQSANSEYQPQCQILEPGQNVPVKYLNHAVGTVSKTFMTSDWLPVYSNATIHFSVHVNSTEIWDEICSTSMIWNFAYEKKIKKRYIEFSSAGCVTDTTNFTANGVVCHCEEGRTFILLNESPPVVS
ncbi:uncharacterized protein LOC117109719 [Anneissia japonica]|uniref:uncharacterized protein LOC117109719 n=1 Tax=Anneissia japonica TaxID=1529436 RepID=UPI0014259B65|nr:uncharacterized protein LOC117109719 [Anneissia japonica]